ERLDDGDAARDRSGPRRHGPGGESETGAGRPHPLPARRVASAQGPRPADRGMETGSGHRAGRAPPQPSGPRDQTRRPTVPSGVGPRRRRRQAPLRVDVGGPMTQRQIDPAEHRYADELAFLAADSGARPPGWRLTPRAVVTFITGSDGQPVAGA